jgi:tRNA(fMet)-specific endonuclease VapC
MGLIFDTSELIAAERQHRSLANMLAAFAPQEEIGISVVTIAEIQHGVRRATEPSQIAKRRALLDSAVSIFKVHTLTPPIALLIGNLDAELTMRGQRLDFADMAIAATAMTLDFSLVTHNLRHFERIPGLRILHP